MNEVYESTAGMKCTEFPPDVERHIKSREDAIRFLVGARFLKPDGELVDYYKE